MRRVLVLLVLLGCSSDDAGPAPSTGYDAGDSSTHPDSPLVEGGVGDTALDSDAAPDGTEVCLLPSVVTLNLAHKER